MTDSEMSRDEMLEELHDLRKRVSRLEDSEALLKQARTALQEEAIRRKMLVEESNDGIVVLTTDGKVWEANQKYADMLGYTFEETQKLSIWDWEKSYPREEVLSMLETVDGRGDHFETRHTRKDGTEYDVEISTNGTMWGEQKLIFCVCRDITERNKNAERLRESEELLSTFIDNFQGIAYQVAPGAIDPFTPELFRGSIRMITGFTADELQMRGGWDTLVHPDDTARLQLFRHNLTHGSGAMSEIQYRIMDRMGTIRWITELARFVTLGNRRLMHGTIYDFTSHKLTEEANIQLEEQIRHSQKLEAIGTLAGGVAHDFNNILGIIMGYTDLVIPDVPPDSKASEKLKRIKKASFRAREIIRQLLTFSRKVGPKIQPVNLSSIITETVSFLRSTISSSISLDYEVPDEKMLILADPTQMHQVIMNLCVNASQALESRRGRGTITLSICRTDRTPTQLSLGDTVDHHAFIQVKVIDNGPGIKPDVAKRIFEPYFTTRETGKGSGMGLAVVHGIIENHHGEITVDSTIGEGTTFTITLPEYSKKIIETEEQSEKSHSGSEAILFIDDEEEIATIARLMLESQGFRVTTATNPMTALEIFRNNPREFDIVVTDMAMPDMSGVQLFNEIHAVRADLPVVLCTGHSSSIDEEKARAMGIAAFIFKPLSKPELTKIIRNVIDRPS